MKFNILTETLPEAVEVDGKVFSFDTSFKSCIEAIITMEDYRLTDEEKLYIIYDIFFEGYSEPPLPIGLKIIKWFIAGGDKKETLSKSSRGKNGGSNTESKKFCYCYDSEVIYSSFLTQYNIDITCDDLHWFKFKALLKGLHPDSEFKSLIRARTFNSEGITDPKKLAKMQQNVNRNMFGDVYAE